MVVLCLLSPWNFAVAATPSPPPADQRHLQVKLRPSEFAELAQHVSVADETQQREFADIALDTLLNAFQHEVEVAQKERPSDAEQRHKLASWRRGTEAMVWRLQALRSDLDAGGALAIHVDSRYQVMIIVNGFAVLVSGPRIEIEPEIERQVVERFCAANDCNLLVGQLTEERAALGQAGESRELWVFRQDTGPLYQIGDLLQCHFATLADRDKKEAICRRLFDELKLFDSAVQQARAQGHRVDWGRLAGAALAEQGESRVVLNAEGAFVRLPLPLLARIRRDDWQRVVSWLRRDRTQPGAPLLIQNVSLLLEGSSLPGDSRQKY